MQQAIESSLEKALNDAFVLLIESPVVVPDTVFEHFNEALVTDVVQVRL